MTTSRGDGPTRRALLIGIDKYLTLPEEFGQLDGCVADVELMRALLEGRFAFPAGNIRMLRNGTATRKRILSALDRLAGQTGPDDIVVIHYAGYGSRVTDREADEPGRLDCTIVPADSAGWSGAAADQRDITADELYVRLLALAEKTAFTTLILDCGHSAPVPRDAFGGKTRSIPPDLRPARRLPPSPVPGNVRERLGGGGNPGGKGRSGWLPIEGSYVLIAACRADEVANEYRPPEGEGRVVHGALTYFLGRELSSAPPGATYGDVFERAAARVNAAYRKQNPQMEGDADREVFGVRAVVGTHPFVPVTGTRGSLIALGAGTAQGVTVGSTYEVHEEGGGDPRAAKPVGRLSVTRVGGLASSARVESGAADRMVAGARAFETEHVWGELRYRVQVEGPENFALQLDTLREELGELPLFEVVKPSRRADARVYVLPTRTATRADSPVPQLRAVRAPSWAVVGPNGRLIAPLRRLDQRADLIQDLQTLARFQLALGLQNPDPRSLLRGRFGLELLRHDGSGGWMLARPDPRSGKVVYDEADRFACRIASRHDGPAYITLLDFSLTGSLNRVHPLRGRASKLPAGRSLDLFTDGSVDLVLPRQYPFANDAEGNVDEGLDTLKLIVTAGPVDFSFLDERGARSHPRPGAGGEPSSLMALFASTFNGSREPHGHPVGGEDWTTVTRTFLVRRKKGKR